LGSSDASNGTSSRIICIAERITFSQRGLTWWLADVAVSSKTENFTFFTTLFTLIGVAFSLLFLPNEVSTDAKGDLDGNLVLDDDGV
jgi:hypothetical protein